MDISAVPQRSARLGLGAIAALVGVLLSLVLFVNPSSGASLVGKDGKVYACYKVKGKAKGTMRLVARRAHCRRGERKATWSVTGPAGQSGAAGQAGSPGAPGPPGEPGLSGEEALETRITELTKEVEVLQAKLAGISALELQNAVAAVADVNALCTQAGTLTTRVNTVAQSIGTIALAGVIPSLLTLTVPTPPTNLPTFTC